MQVPNQASWQNNYLLSIAKSFLIWAFTLTVCFLVVGFPLVVVIMTVGVLASVVLQSILPASAIVLVSGGILTVISLLIMFASVILTVKGVHPHDVKWLGWLQEKDKTSSQPVYASCPLTCSINQF
jgi:hypothetical protein